ncbi:hypothetical protein ACFQI3_15085 [Hansschlegelia quercus]|nr:hypothetical protein [Hansschlegelia quercus]
MHPRHRQKRPARVAALPVAAIAFAALDQFAIIGAGGLIALISFFG